MSGRGVAFELLSPEAKRKSDELAVQRLPKDATGYQFFSSKLREGVRSFLREVTDELELKSVFETSDGKSPTWHTLTYSELTTPTNDYNLEDGGLFTPADIETLEALYKMHHEPNQDDVEKLFKGASPLA